MNQWLLSQCQIEYPIFKILADYRYRKVGVPTVFDELLMSLAIDFPQLKNNTLNDIVETLQLDEAFVLHTLKNLLDTGLIEGCYFDKGLDNVNLSELVLTDNGRKFYREKKMPGKPRKAQECFYFNPLSREIADKLYENNQKIDLQLDRGLFSLNNEILQHLSLEEMKNFSWVTADVELEEKGISTEIDDNNKWQKVNVRLFLDQNRNLTLECQDVLFKQWLNSLNSAFLRENLLIPLLKIKENIYFCKTKLDAHLLSNENLVNFMLLDKEISGNEFPSDVLMLKVTPNNQELISTESPLIVLSQLYEEATLKNQTLFIPNEWDLPENLIKIYVSIKEKQLFAEREGYLPAYFEHQEVDLPIKYVEKWNEKLTDLDTFKNPNLDTLIFLANFKPEQEILKELPRMRIQQAVDFSQKITDVWRKNFSPLQWVEKIEQLSTKEDLAQFLELFKVLPEFSHLDVKLQNVQIDLALQEPKSEAAKFSKLKNLIELSNDLAKFNDKKLPLNLVNTETLEKLKQWEKVIVEFADNDSSELIKRRENFTFCKNQILTLFEPIQESEKFAVLDTNYIINHSDKLDKLENSYRLILPKMVLAELDKLKKECQGKLLDFDDEISKIEPILQAQLEKISDLRDQIKQCNSNLERLNKDSIDEIKKVKTERMELEKNKKFAEKELGEIESEKNKIEKNRNEVGERDFKIRKAAKKLSELQFEQVNENVGILELLEEPTKMVADDKILAVACAYKLNDITLYTGDNILKAKAKCIGIKTFS